MNEITVVEFAEILKQKEDFILLDVRTEKEYKIANLGGMLIPDYEISTRYAELPQDKKIIVLCHHGIRSLNVTNFLISKDFKQVYNLSGGIHKYAVEIDPAIAVY